MINRLVWLHDEALALFDPQALLPQDKVVFVWDNRYFRSKGWSLKRLVFVYEALQDLPYTGLQVYQGETLSVLQQIIQEQAICEIVAIRPREAELCELADCLAQSVKLYLLEAPSLLSEPPSSVPRRFFAFWKQVEPQVLGEKVFANRQRVR